MDPFFSTDALAVLGMNTARSNTWKDGRISLAQIDDLRRRLGPLPPHVSKVLVTHHPFLPPPGDPSPPLVGRAAEALQAAEACGVDLVLAGHLHRGYTGDIRTHHADIRRGILVAQAGTAVSHRVRNEANGYNVIRLSPQRLGFAVRAWDGRGFHEARFVEYVKSGHDWRPTREPRLARARSASASPGRLAQLLQPPPPCATFASRPLSSLASPSWSWPSLSCG